MDNENAQKLVAHLRFVHFSLVSVVTGLLITTSVDPGGSAAIAFRDLTEISRHLLNIDEGWFEAYVENQIELSDPVFEAEKRLDVTINTVVNDESFNLALPVSYMHYFFYPPFPALGYDVDANLFESKTLMRGSVGDITGYISIAHRLPDQVYDFETLTDIKILWNLLLVTDAVHQILRVGDQVLVVTDSEHSFLADPARDEYVERWLLSMARGSFELPRLELVPLNDPQGKRWANYIARVVSGPLDEFRQIFALIDDESTLVSNFLTEEVVGNYDVVRWLRFSCSDDDDNICFIVGVPIASWGVPINGLNHFIGLRNKEDGNNWQRLFFRNELPGT